MSNGPLVDAAPDTVLAALDEVLAGADQTALTPAQVDAVAHAAVTTEALDYLALARDVQAIAERMSSRNDGRHKLERAAKAIFLMGRDLERRMAEDAKAREAVEQLVAAREPEPTIVPASLAAKADVCGACGRPVGAVAVTRGNAVLCARCGLTS